MTIVDEPFTATPPPSSVLSTPGNKPIKRLADMDNEKMKRVAMKGNWSTPPTPLHRKWEVADAKTFIQRLSIDEPGSPKRVPLSLQTALDEWVSKERFILTKEISPTISKSVVSKVQTSSSFIVKVTEETTPVRRKVGLAVCGDGDGHRDPCKPSPEHCSRISAIVKALGERKELNSLLVNLSEQARLATDSELLSIHTKGYLKKLQKITDSACGNHGKEHDRAVNAIATEEFDSVYMTTKSLEAAKMSAGAALACVESVCEGKVQVAAAAIRPPGHHAESHCAMGFCFFNNAALAARRALDLGVKRVLIVDQDIHHGNGTQRAFWDDDRVLYFSVHRWDKGRFYPHNEIESAPSCVGPKDTPAAGRTINVAFCDGEMGDLEYRAVWESILLPVASEFKPELILFSAGFDAAEGDPIGKYHVSPGCFGAMVGSLLAKCPMSKAVLLLEGGYNTAVTAEAFCECVRILSYPAHLRSYSTTCGGSAEWPSFTQWLRVKQQAVDSINETIAHQKAYWSKLVPVTHRLSDDGKTVVPKQ